jgi:hypothetical protein
LVERISVFWNCMWCSLLKPCSAICDLSIFLKQMCHWCSSISSPSAIISPLNTGKVAISVCLHDEMAILMGTR